jgi:hypothetical protein
LFDSVLINKFKNLSFSVKQNTTFNPYIGGGKNMKLKNLNPAQYERGSFPFGDVKIYSKGFSQRTRRKRRTQRRKRRTQRRRKDKK